MCYIIYNWVKISKLDHVLYNIELGKDYECLFIDAHSVLLLLGLWNSCFGETITKSKGCHS